MARVNGVLGPIETGDLGFTLMHEHILVANWSMRHCFPDYVDLEKLIREAIGEMGSLQERGVRTMVDLTPINLGRDIRVIREVAEKTLHCFHRAVPAAVPGIVFLSGGQSDEAATEHLSLMNKMDNLPWALTFSYGRALQAAALKAWGGKSENVAAAQRAFTHRAKMNGKAALGEWEQSLEQAA